MSLQNCLRHNYTLLNLTGMCKIKSHSTFKKYLRYLWRLTINLNVLYFCCSSLVYVMVEKIDDFQEEFLSYIDFGCSLTALIRLNYFYVFDELTENIYNEMCRLFKCETQTGFEDKNLQKSTDLVKNLTRLWIVGGSVGSMCVLVAPLIFGKYSERKLPFGIWYPFDWKASPYYELLIVYQAVVMLTMSYSVIGVDMFFACCVILTSAQFEFLGWEAKYLVHAILLRNGIDEFIAQDDAERKEEVHLGASKIEDALHKIGFNHIDGIVSSETFHNDLLEALNKQVEFHQSLMNFSRFLEELFSPIYLPYVVLGTATAVFMGFNFTTFQSASMGIVITSGFTLTLMVVTLLWPCYLGQVLLTQTENLFDDIYGSLWYICDEKFKVNFKILCYAARKPIRLTLGKFSCLSLAMYLKVINSIVSYVIILRQIAVSNQ